MPDRETLIRNITIGDIFRAQSPNGASLICRARKVTKAAIDAQRLFMRGETFLFDRITGMANSDGVPCRIDSVAPLPEDIRQVLLALDHRHRTSNNLDDAKLSEAEKHALLFIYDHYRENLI